jgi:hypothetical protein
VTSLAVDNSTNLTSEGLKHLSRLRKFEFKRSHIPFYAFRALTGLHKLNIENCVLKLDEQGRDHAIRDLAKMTQLTELNVSLEGLRDRHIGYIARCRQLHTLHALWLHHVTEEGLAKLTRLTDLKWYALTPPGCSTHVLQAQHDKLRFSDGPSARTARGIVCAA